MAALASSQRLFRFGHDHCTYSASVFRLSSALNESDNGYPIEANVPGEPTKKAQIRFTRTEHCATKNALANPSIYKGVLSR